MFFAEGVTTMGNRQNFDPKKTLEVLLYIAQQSSDMYNVLKVLYFADKDHLEKYGRLISGEDYVAMEKGPVPSGAYDIIKSVRGDGYINVVGLDLDESFHMDGYILVPHRGPNLELLSESDIECLDAAIEKFGHMGFGKLMEICHEDSAFQAADRNDFISLDVIINSLPSAEDLRDYLSAN